MDLTIIEWDGASYSRGSWHVHYNQRGNGIQRGQIYSLFSFRQTTCQFIANTNKNIRFLLGWKQKRVIKRPCFSRTCFRILLCCYCSYCFCHSSTSLQSILSSLIQKISPTCTVYRGAIIVDVSKYKSKEGRMPIIMNTQGHKR